MQRIWRRSLTALFCGLLILKLLGYNIGWAWVFAPLWIPLAGLLIIACLMGLTLMLVWWITKE